MARNEGWAFYKHKGDDLGLWLVVGFFITQWGVSELLGDILVSIQPVPPGGYSC